jgi:hypothetical protein
LTIARFCARERISVASFYYWRKRLGHRHGRRRMTDRRGDFQQVAVIPAGSGMVWAAPAVCILLPCGTRIELRGEDLDAVRTVIGEVVRADHGRDAGVASC